MEGCLETCFLGLFKEILYVSCKNRSFILTVFCVLFQTGQTFNPTSIDLVDGSTSPPNLLTEADLIALMEKHGIGNNVTPLQGPSPDW